MTTTVKVSAHCAASLTEVHVIVHNKTEPGDIIESFVLQDGESRDVVVFDLRCVSVVEMPKQAFQASEAAPNLADPL